LTPLSAIDTDVIVEYMDEAGDFHFQAKWIIDSITSGKLLGVIAHPVLAELYYVSYRLYERNYAVVKDNESPESRAGKLINWLFKSPNVLVPDSTVELAIEAGKIKQKFSLALADSYVIASAKSFRCKAIFKRKEEEMSRGNKLKRLTEEDSVSLVFLEDYA